MFSYTESAEQGKRVATSVFVSCQKPLIVLTFNGSLFPLDCLLCPSLDRFSQFYGSLYLFPGRCSLFYKLLYTIDFRKSYNRNLAALELSF